MTRYYCEFKKCNCNQFISNSKICDICNHANIWHSKKGKPPPKDGELQFMSPRKNARKPKYAFDIIFTQIFTPEIPIVESVEIDRSNFCSEVGILPV